MRRRRRGLALGIAVVCVLVCGPVLAAAMHRMRESGHRRDLARAAAVAWRETDYRGSIAWERVAPRRPPESDAGRKFVPFGGWGSRDGWSVRVSHSGRRNCTEYKGDRFPAWRAMEPSARFPDPAAWCLDVGAMLENYAATEPVETAFHGRRAFRFRVEPRYEGRPTLELTVDADTSLPLKVASWDHAGNLYRVAAFREVAVGEDGPALARSDRQPRDFRGSSIALRDVAERIDFDPFLPDYLPEGFRRIDCRTREGITPRLRVSWSDGVTVFDLEQARIPTPAQAEHHFRRRGGRQRAEGFVRWSQERRLRAVLAAEEGDGPEAVPVRCVEVGSHRRYELWVEGVELTLTARSDLEPSELVKVLQSLRRA